jgi:predicted MPP superfamily phosphohydrolase
VIAFVGFVSMVLTVLALMHYYMWRRAVRSTTVPGGRARRIGTLLIVTAYLLTATAQAGVIFIPRELATPLAWVGFSWLGFAFYFFLFLLTGELIRLGVRIRSRERAPVTVAVSEPVSAAVEPAALRTAERTDRTSGPDPTNGPDRPSGPDRTSEPMTVDAREVTRRLFLSRSIALGAGVAAAGVGGYGLSRAMADPVVRRVPVQIYGLDPRLAGFRIAMFSDAHLGAIRRKPAMEKLVDTVNGTEPDMVAVLGDLIDGSVADLGGDVAPMAGLLSPQGSFFVTGNHEYYSGVQEWVDYLPDLGVRVLSNERLTIERDGAALDLAGVTDITGEGYDDSPDYEAALAGRRADRPVVLLCHQPVNVDKAVEYGVDLQLSGHTHGGQLWPFHYLIAAQQGAVSGLSRIEDTQLYVTVGAGFWGPPMRVGADPEVVVIELHPQDRII